MIEVIYKDEKQEMKDGTTEWELPKNIRQIGLVSGDYRIYIEDYVYTFLHRAAQTKGRDEENGSCLAILLGEARWRSGNGVVFIRGALLTEGEEISEEHIEITQNMWQTIHEEQEKYFEGQEIVGWFLACQSLSMEASELIQKVHRKQFGAEKIVMLLDTAEQEEAFFRYENNFLVRQSGYYIYYEKNTQMQNYMLEKNPQLQKEEQETVQDDAVKAFRSLIQKKKKEDTEETEEKTSAFSYAAVVCLALTLVVAGARFYRNHQAEQKPEEEIQTASANLRQEMKVTPALTAVPKSTVSADKMTPTETPKPTPTADLTAVPTVSISEKEEQIYKEEADVRKARRRIENSRKNTETETAAAQTQKSYTIRPGDTLYQISIEKYGTMDKVTEICRANGISEDEIIYPGQIIVLP